MQDQEHYLLNVLELIKGTRIDWKSLDSSNAVHMCVVANEEVVTNGLPRAKHTTQISLQCVCQGTLLGPHHTQRATTPHGRTARQVSKVKWSASILSRTYQRHSHSNPRNGIVLKTEMVLEIRYCIDQHVSKLLCPRLGRFSYS